MPQIYEKLNNIHQHLSFLYASECLSLRFLSKKKPIVHEFLILKI
ncbi:hypothetical protein HMPREF1981_00011 [Bacteroides pyogenes F0041]|uniref:Uncharacterized protein n=1 Tax=Bacteroides pyogenes F0041 TaxID=1321819 RepID=U2CXM4_9BACE|nr:hypothetical protein HMPREF1981_00011 [Bacteroides pyogenes F0041]